MVEAELGRISGTEEQISISEKEAFSLIQTKQLVL